MTWVRRSAAIAACSLLVVACGGGDGDDLDRALDATTTTGTDAGPGTSAPVDGPDGSTPAADPGDDASVPPVDWSDCGSAECATYDVPLDHAAPDGEQIELSLLRLPATGDRIGALFLNFGGPGAGTVSTVPTFPVPGDVRERFDIVAMDPRGVGGSTPLSCGLDAQTVYSVDPTIEDQIDADTLLDVSRRYARDCGDRRGDLLPHLGTRDVARDMDRVRAAMGDDQLSYLGFSYGTSIGQAYAELFPDRVRTMILDGVVDPADDGIAVATEQAQGFETALANWAADCDARSSCRFGDPIAAVDQVLARAEDGIESSDGVRALGPGEASVGLAFPLYSQGLWSTLDEAIADAIDGDGAGMIALASRYETLVDFSIYFAVSCLDSTWPRDVDRFLAAAEGAGEVAPRFGEAIVNDYIRCAVWPTEPDPLGAITAPGAAPILVVSTTGDPATPYENGVRVAERLASGSLLTFEGEGHTIVFQGSPCVDRVAIDYLIDLVVPPDGDRC